MRRLLKGATIRATIALRTKGRKWLILRFDCPLEEARQRFWKAHRKHRFLSTQVRSNWRYIDSDRIEVFSNGNQIAHFKGEHGVPAFVVWLRAIGKL